MKKVFISSILSFALLIPILSFDASIASAKDYVTVNGKKFYFAEPKISGEIKISKQEIPWGTGVASGKEVIKFLQKKGFVKVSQNGSHVKLKGPNGKQTVVPVHGNKDLPKGTLNSILKQAGIKIK